MQQIQHTGQAAINQDAADGGYWHQRALIDALARWRTSMLGARLALGLFGPMALHAKSMGANPMADPAAKPDLMAWMIDSDGQRREIFVSAKLARIGSTDSDARPMHHAGRVKFEDAPHHGLLPENDIELRGALLSHFVDGEPLSRQEANISSRALDFLAENWRTIARSAIAGQAAPHADFVAVSLAEAQEDGTLALRSTRIMTAQDAIDVLCQTAPTHSDPRDGQVGTIGSKFMHIQRGQALSLGEQRDIQIKINAGALHAAAADLPAPVVG